MSQKVLFATLTVAAFFALAMPLSAAEAATPSGMQLSGAVGAALTILGAAYGIGKIGSSAVEAMARQPEVASQINTAMIIAAALIEGVTFFALIVCIIHGNPWPVAGN